LASFYPETPMAGVLFGTFANRNSTGVFLVSALTFACLLPPLKAHPMELPARIAVCALLLVAIVLTKSRTSLALAGLPLLLVTARFAFDRVASASGDRSGATRALQLGVGALVAILAGVSLFAAAPGRLGDTLERFDSDGNAREFIWEDSLYASQRYWPAGAGMGTFDEVFQVDEALENLTARRAGRAHNDYLEVAIEAGLPGLLAIAAWLLALAWLTWRARYSPHRWTAWSGSAILLAIALQSITDYPLRNQAMLAVAAFALLLLARVSSDTKRREGTAP
ncbi:MAG: O-antigen ligase family protein, partial [Pseudomonadota bacterium]